MRCHPKYVTRDENHSVPEFTLLPPTPTDKKKLS
jgi:hypothetical protein